MFILSAYPIHNEIGDVVPKSCTASRISSKEFSNDALTSIFLLIGEQYLRKISIKFYFIRSCSNSQESKQARFISPTKELRKIESCVYSMSTSNCSETSSRNETCISDPRTLLSLEACKTRAILTAEQAILIFQIMQSHGGIQSIQSGRLRPSAVARAFGVSEKTVRDIWKGRTWLRETMHLDPARFVTAAARLRPPGRPRGSRSLRGPPPIKANSDPPPPIAGAPSSSPSGAGDDRAPPAAELIRPVRAGEIPPARRSDPARGGGDPHDSVTLSHFEAGPDRKSVV